MPRIIQTNPDGSPVSDYLAQSARGRPFHVGRVQTLPDGRVYGYSGLINFDVSVSATYEMIKFQLERDVLLQAHFEADWRSAYTIGDDIGFQISIDGTEIYRWTSKLPAWGGNTAIYEVQPYGFLVPANKECIINIMNLESSASSTINGNVTLLGHQL